MRVSIALFVLFLTGWGREAAGQVPTLQPPIFKRQSSQDQGQPPVDPSPVPAPPPRTSGNGIGVTDLKPFDNRTLVLMLDTLNESLQRIQVVDQKALQTALGNISGTRVSDVSRAFTIQGGIRPELTDVSTTNQSRVDVTGASPTITNTTGGTTSSTAKSPAVLPLIPWNFDSIAAPANPLPIGLNAGDLLNDQVNLTYQIFNLRMILDRSLSDRLLLDVDYPTGGWQPRLQTVLGLNVSLDPQRDALDSAAIVRVHLKMERKIVSAKFPDKFVRPDLVAMMPLEKTYNATALNTKSNAFGAAAVARMVSVGYSERRRGQLFYVFRDQDTVAFNEMPSGKDSWLTFGWQFRPVLGRRTVAAGMRQLFAVVSLPLEDLEAIEQGAVKLVARVDTFWVKYDGEKQSTTLANQVPFWSRMAYLASLGTTVSPYPSRRSRFGVEMDTLIPATASFQQSLRPRIDEVEWKDVGGGQAAVSVKGRNFFAGTQMLMGGQVLGGGSGLVIKSEKEMDVRTSIESMSSDAVVSGRYGKAVELVDPSWDMVLPPQCALEMKRADFQKAINGVIPITVVVGESGAGCVQPLTMKMSKVGQNPPVITMGGKVVPGPYDFADDGNGVQVSAFVSEESFTASKGLVTLRFPFRGSRWVATRQIYNPDDSFQVSRLAPKSTGTDALLLIEKRDGWSFGEWKIVVEDKLIPLTTCGLTITGFCRFSDFDRRAFLLYPKLPAEASTLSMVDPDGYSYRLSVPATKPVAAKPTVVAAAQTVKQNDSVWLIYQGTETKELGGVNANGSKLEFDVGTDGKTVAVQLTREITKAAGKVEIVFLDKTEKQIGRGVVTVECVSCDAKKP